MPEFKEHMELSLKRTGKDFKDLHEWIEGNFNDHLAKERHDISKITEHFPHVRTLWGETGVSEFLYHIKDDYNHRLRRHEDNLILRFAATVFRFFKKSR